MWKDAKCQALLFTEGNVLPNCAEVVAGEAGAAVGLVTTKLRARLSRSHKNKCHLIPCARHTPTSFGAFRQNKMVYVLYICGDGEQPLELLTRSRTGGLLDGRTTHAQLSTQVSTHRLH